MRLLAIDTALNACSVAVLDDGDAGRLETASEAMERGHAERLIGMIGEVLADAELSFNDLDRIVATVGPGSFTGVRVGLATARGLGLVLKKPVVGVTTLAALAESGRGDGGDATPVAAVIDARRGEIYAELNGAGAPSAGPRVCSAADFAKDLPSGTRLVGSAAEEVARAADACGTAVTVVSARAAPPIAAVARLGAAAPPPGAPPAPLYLRAPDAKPQADARLARV
ncbi:tRNA threonylcarbamoyladenosine biosynthesis protein TsaB [Rhodobium orientis]|uniref:tRNA (Adenosine(37)-N6)-threonylcarbamoyltransferase complex dimerization subunit type 1 TsaB n=1 Tax=Rhodobium orientis TaxID=34017 RepID=A0A327JKL4_9HYPH|nr:tRNA (adenosine(37)-N6)-threonylcarbamoyltransferase complex dimerization subunit type 1 TsaB [Rhodobium orientis]MBB4304503.1 tRNA threonylcarbamoyladenosine biosynthesis protein TsaB [Rhodobium orientis]MBK5948094.1 tRNA (adenosine(37)-N6)-threonylcarbamoyltransferase complex dimerization subunit type 1 TsaB [Rhodobium orientis]RAI26176.1 tRNA (adenosine(37)-N6)-threonylcarbamoyltransferase complex dimerization subunit type 1 TsaB [Rhodobium orientis]